MEQTSLTDIQAFLILFFLFGMLVFMPIIITEILKIRCVYGNPDNVCKVIIPNKH